MAKSSRSTLENDVLELYPRRFDAQAEIVVSAPGRVNLIGEHTDYNNGFVFPAAINCAIAIAAGPRPDNRLLLHAENIGATMLLDLHDLSPRQSAAWSNYPGGVAYFLRKRGLEISGANLVIKGNIPRGAGLSSSAALEVATAYALLELNHLSLPSLEVVKLCQQAENEFVGVQCGIMDQFISTLGRKGHALRIDCRSLQYEHVPFPEGFRLVVCDTHVRRNLAQSQYNRRREECLEGVRLLARKFTEVRSLRDATLDQLQSSGLDPVILKRCRHVITENERVERSVAALRAGNVMEFGALMDASHASLRDDYQVSCAELNAAVEICRSAEGTLGARMTGGGFGGSAICLVREASVEAVSELLNREYPMRTGKSPGILVSSFEDGVSVRVPAEAHRS
jgi:galactokinase